MAVKRHYKCPKHGFFESWEAVCTHGCLDGIKVAFLKAPAYLSDKTKRNDANLKGLANEFNMTNIKSTREGEHQEGYLTRNNGPKVEQPPEQRPGSGVIWGGGAGHSMQSILGGGIKSVRGESVGFNPKEAGELRGPRAASYVGDHENLQVKP